MSIYAELVETLVWFVGYLALCSLLIVWLQFNPLKRKVLTAMQFWSFELVWKLLPYLEQNPVYKTLLMQRYEELQLAVLNSSTEAYVGRVSQINQTNSTFTLEVRSPVIRSLQVPFTPEQFPVVSAAFSGYTNQMELQVVGTLKYVAIKTSTVFNTVECIYRVVT